jgi:ABC-2 type transport system ATP-binding protein
MLVNLDPRDARPLYLQIMDEVRRAVVVGTLKAEDPLPSVRELAGELVVNPRTVSQAYQELEREGVIYVRRGQGTFRLPHRPARRRRAAQPGAGGGQTRASGGAEERRGSGGTGEHDSEAGGEGGRMSRAAESFAVATHALSLRYGNEMALSGVDLRIPECAVYVLVGANGAGKSTAMKVLLNLERADAGGAEVFGLDTVTHGPQVRAQVGYIPESHGQDYQWMTCGRLIDHVAVHYPTWDRAYAAHLIEMFDVRLQRKVGTLSKGETRRLQFVLALAHRPSLLLLDEPTDGLDPVVRNRALAQLAEHLADSPATVVIATHHIAEVDSLADHVGVLRGGRLIAQMSRDHLRRTVLRYRVDVPEGWQPPPDLRISSLRRSRGGREAQWTLEGDEADVTARLAACTCCKSASAKTRSIARSGACSHNTSSRTRHIRARSTWSRPSAPRQRRRKIRR